MILENKVDLQKLRENPDTKDVRDQLLTLSGVGPKVADCILLFSDLKRFEVFPIDVWVRRVMNDLYIKEEDETKVSKVKIEKIANEKFGNLAGLAQQYLFYWRRWHKNIKKEKVMGLRIIYGKSGSGKSEYCFKEIAKLIKEEKKIYIITPEQFSFTAEKK